MKLKNLLFSLFFLLFSAGVSQAMDKEEELELLQDAKEIFQGLPKSLIDANKHADLIKLGKKLYLDANLSKSKTISCNSCHKLDQFGVDNEPTSPGHDGTRGERNSPTVYNSGLNFVQFWDGRAKDLEEQALGPLLNPIEHGLASEEEVIKAITTDEYTAMFKKSFKSEKSPVTFINVGKAIAAFEKTLLTPSRFDDYLNGDLNALTAKEKRGLETYFEAGCTSCHAGPNLGGQMYQKLGALKEYKTKDTGRFQVTKEDKDKYVFKVPGLRNVTKTAPYFHDGSVKTLDEAISIMAEYQTGIKLSKEEIDNIKAFLASTEAKKLPF